MTSSIRALDVYARKKTRLAIDNRCIFKMSEKKEARRRYSERHHQGGLQWQPVWPGHCPWTWPFHREEPGSVGHNGWKEDHGYHHGNHNWRGFLWFRQEWWWPRKGSYCPRPRLARVILPLPSILLSYHGDIRKPQWGEGGLPCKAGPFSFSSEVAYEVTSMSQHYWMSLVNFAMDPSWLYLCACPLAHGFVLSLRFVTMTRHPPCCHISPQYFTACSYLVIYLYFFVFAFSQGNVRYYPTTICRTSYRSKNSCDVYYRGTDLECGVAPNRMNGCVISV